jgi:hypothetical protein
MDEMKEWVAPESNKMQAMLPNNVIVPVTTMVAFASVFTLLGVREYTLYVLSLHLKVRVLQGAL